jgi:hypothetical protein
LDTILSKTGELDLFIKSFIQYTMKVLQNKFAKFIVLIFVIPLVVNCSSDDKGPSNTTKKVIFKAEASTGSSINMAVYGYDATLTTVSSINNQSWTSPEITVPASANVASVIANAMGANAASTLKVQVYVNGVLKKEGTSTGTALSATAQYDLE